MSAVAAALAVALACLQPPAAAQTERPAAARESALARASARNRAGVEAMAARDFKTAARAFAEAEKLFASLGRHEEAAAVRLNRALLDLRRGFGERAQATLEALLAGPSLAPLLVPKARRVLAAQLRDRGELRAAAEQLARAAAENAGLGLHEEALGDAIDEALCLRDAGLPEEAFGVLAGALGKLDAKTLDSLPLDLQDRLFAVLGGRLLHWPPEECARRARRAAAEGRIVLAVGLHLTAARALFFGRHDREAARAELEAAKRTALASPEAERLLPSLLVAEARILLRTATPEAVELVLAPLLAGESAGPNRGAALLLAGLAARKRAAPDLALRRFLAAATALKEVEAWREAFRAELLAARTAHALGDEASAERAAERARELLVRARLAALDPEFPPHLRGLADRVWKQRIDLRLRALPEAPAPQRARLAFEAFVLCEERKAGLLVLDRCPRRRPAPFVEWLAASFAGRGSGDLLARVRHRADAAARPAGPLSEAAFAAKLGAGEGILALHGAGAEAAAFLLTRRGLSWARLGPGEDLRKAARRYLRLLAARPGPGAALALWAAGRALRERLLGPLAARVAGLRRLAFSPGPELEGLPPAALLFGPEAATTRWSELRFLGPDLGCACRTLPSALLAGTEEPGPAAPRHGVWVLGRAPFLRAPADLGLPALGPVRLLAPGPPPEGAPFVLHVAAHAGRGGLAFAGRRLTTGDLGAVAPGIANLAACASAWAPPARFGMRQGFALAFLLRGARHVLAAAWTLEDEAAFRFNRAFYRALASAPEREAPRAAEAAYLAAQKSLRRDPGRSAPFYWAPLLLFARR